MSRLVKPMMMAVAKLTPACREITRTISDSMDRKLSLKERIGLKLHIMSCVLCERYQTQMIALNKMLNKYSLLLDEEEMLGGTRLKPEAKERIKKMIEMEH